MDLFKHSPVQGQKDSQGAGAPLLRRQAERGGALQPEKEKA